MTHEELLAWANTKECYENYLGFYLALESTPLDLNKQQDLGTMAAIAKINNLNLKIWGKTSDNKLHWSTAHNVQCSENINIAVDLEGNYARLSTTPGMLISPTFSYSDVESSYQSQERGLTIDGLVFGEVVGKVKLRDVEKQQINFAHLSGGMALKSNDSAPTSAVKQSTVTSEKRTIEVDTSLVKKIGELAEGLGRLKASLRQHDPDVQKAQAEAKKILAEQKLEKERLAKLEQEKLEQEKIEKQEHKKRKGKEVVGSNGSSDDIKQKSPDHNAVQRRHGGYQVELPGTVDQIFRPSLTGITANDQQIIDNNDLAISASQNKRHLKDHHVDYDALYDYEEANNYRRRDFARGFGKGVLFNTALNGLCRAPLVGGYISAGLLTTTAGVLYGYANSMATTFEQDNFHYTPEYREIMRNPLLSNEEKQQVSHNAEDRHRQAKQNRASSSSTSIVDNVTEMWRERPEQLGNSIGLFFGFGTLGPKGAGIYAARFPIKPQLPIKLATNKIRNNVSRKIEFKNGFIYEDAPYHTAISTSIKSKRPTNPEVLKTSVQIKPSAPARISYDHKTEEIIMFYKHEENTFHGFVKTWEQLEQEHRNILVKEFAFNLKGKQKPRLDHN